MHEAGRSSLAGRVALVTGASRGIGRAVALELAERGARVVVNGRDEAALNATRDAIRARGAHADALVCDLRDPRLIERLDAVAPQVDVLINNAAAFARYAALERVDARELEAVLDVIVRAPLRLIAHVLPGMQARGFGRIVNVGSMAAEMGAHGQVAYGAAKAALVGMTRSVAAEAAPRGVTCNLVQLGLIDTERIAAAVDPRVQRRVLANVAVGRMGTTGEAAHAVAMLCMPRASYVTGAVLAVSGGMGVGLYAREV